MGYSVKKYLKEDKISWNSFLHDAKNGTFLLNRNYMDYHQDRFQDHSILIYLEDKIIAVFPANEKGTVIESHGGLSYGGLIYGSRLRTKSVIEIMESVIQYYAHIGYTELIYKCIPSIYFKYPAFEVEYALFKLNAELFRRDISSTIDITRKLKLSKGRKWLLARGKKNSLEIKESLDFSRFFEEYKIHLNDKYGSVPVHSDSELASLANSFPEDLKLFCVYNVEGDFLGGSILFITDEVVHAQYIHFTNEGKDLGAFDLLMDYLLIKYDHKHFFDFGISTENEGKYLNDGLIEFKESFGGRGTICDFYRIHL